MVFALYVHLMVEQLGHRVAAQRFDDFAQDGLHVVRPVADHGDAEDGKPAILLGLDLSHGYVEVIPQPVLDTLHHLPLVFQGATLAEQQAQTEGADYHKDEA
jgi:hypothetical protein